VPVTRHLAFTRWETGDDWRTGTRRGTRIVDGDLVVGRPIGMLTEGRTAREYAAWTTPWVSPGFPVEELVASWSATTPRGSLVKIHVRGRGTTWDCLGRWSSGSARTSVSGQDRVDTDTWRPGGTESWQLRLTLVRTPGTHGPAVHMLGAVSSAGRPRSTRSRPGRTVGTVLDVPRLSQMSFRDVGGRGWCSPTSVAMVLGHAGRLPPGTDVPAAAAATHDLAYEGTGNWPFNTAWAAGLAGHAFVTRLRDLRDVERFIAAGIPIVASVAYPRGALTGAPTRSTDGHLVVIRGFTEDGDVVTNDPAAPTERSVRRTYDRAEFERAWLGPSGGTVYVIHDDAHPLPPRGRGGPW
jgi:hypothetical protein